MITQQKYPSAPDKSNLYVDIVDTVEDLPIWDILFNDGLLSIWACFYCIDRSDDIEVSNLITYPVHAFFYSIELEDYESKIETIKKSTITSVLFNHFIKHCIEDIDSNIHDFFDIDLSKEHTLTLVIDKNVVRCIVDYYNDSGIKVNSVIDIDKT